MEYDYTSPNSSSSRATFSVKAGDILHVIRRLGTWILALKADGSQGYIPLNYCRIERENKLEIVEKESPKFYARHSYPLFKLKCSLHLKYPVDGVACSKNFFLLTYLPTRTTYICDLSKNVIVEKKGTYRNLVYFRRKDGFDEFFGVKAIKGSPGSTFFAVKIVKVGFCGYDLILEESTLKQPIGNDVIDYITPVGENHFMYIVNSEDLLTRYFRFVDCSRDVETGRVRSHVNIELSCDAANISLVEYYEKKSEVVILTTEKHLELTFLKTENGFPIQTKVSETKQQLQFKNIYHEQIMIWKNVVTVGNRDVLFTFFKILKERDICIVSCRSSKTSHRLFFIDLMTRKILSSKDVDFCFFSFEVLGGKYLIFPKMNKSLYSTDPGQSLDDNYFHKIAYMNVETKEFEDHHLEVIIPKPFMVDYNHGMFTTLLPADYEDGESGLKVIIWEVGSVEDDLMVERISFLLDCREDYVQFIDVKICELNIVLPRILVLCM